MPRFTEGLSWTFTDVKEEGDSAAITAEITNRDLGALIAAFLQEAFSQMMSTIFLPEDQQPTEEEQTEKLRAANEQVAADAASAWLYLYPQIVVARSNVSGYGVNGLNSQFFVSGISKN